jgi:membrane fusion protein (multidrug efflux system)
MAEPSLKVVSEAPSTDTAVVKAPRKRRRLSRGRLRMILLVGVPLIALVVGVVFYLGSGRYITTDNAYVGAQKVLITPDISGKIDHIAVREGEHVKAGDELFRIDPEPYRLAAEQAQAKLATARVEYSNLKSDYQIYAKLSGLAHKNADLKQKDVERKKNLAESRAGSQVDYETALSAQLTARLQAQLSEQRKEQALNQLLGDADLPIEKFPAYQQAKAGLDQAQRDLDHTTLRAPIDGVATQVDSIQLGRFVTAGTPVFAVIDDSAPWVDANPKETDITYLRVGQPVTVEVDTFPDHPFTGTVAAVSPGTGSQFAILPPQNASGNWVKVVQRVPVRIKLDPDPENVHLRAGMSTTISIDTGKEHSLFGGLFSSAGPAAPR